MTTTTRRTRKPAPMPGYCSLCRSTFRGGSTRHGSTAKHRTAMQGSIPDVLGRIAPNWTKAGWHSTPAQAYGIFEADFVPDPEFAALLTPAELAEWEAERALRAA